MIRILIASLAALGLAASAAAGGFYVSTFGGANLHDAYGGEGAKAVIALDPSTGYTAGAALGSRLAFLPGARAEVEVSWRTNPMSGLFDACHDTALDGNDGTFAAMANLAYDFGSGPLRPYLLIGAGYSARRIQIDPTPDNWILAGYGTERQGFAWQAGAGLDYDVGHGVRAGLGYRYFSGIAINRDLVIGGKGVDLHANNDHHALIATLTFPL